MNNPVKNVDVIFIFDDEDDKIRLSRSRKVCRFQRFVK